MRAAVCGSEPKEGKMQSVARHELTQHPHLLNKMLTGSWATGAGGKGRLKLNSLEWLPAPASNFSAALAADAN
eukprot:16408-Amphidinium_carterae.2